MRVIDLGMIDTAEKSLTAGHQFRQADVDLIFLPSCRHLCAFLDRSSRRSPRQSTGDCSQSFPRAGD